MSHFPDGDVEAQTGEWLPLVTESGREAGFSDPTSAGNNVNEIRSNNNSCLIRSELRKQTLGFKF